MEFSFSYRPYRSAVEILRRYFHSLVGQSLHSRVHCESFFSSCTPFSFVKGGTSSSDGGFSTQLITLNDLQLLLLLWSCLTCSWMFILKKTDALSNSNKLRISLWFIPMGLQRTGRDLVHSTGWVKKPWYCIEIQTSINVFMIWQALT